MKILNIHGMLVSMSLIVTIGITSPVRAEGAPRPHHLGVLKTSSTGLLADLKEAHDKSLETRLPVGVPVSFQFSLFREIRNNETGRIERVARRGWLIMSLGEKASDTSLAAVSYATHHNSSFGGVLPAQPNIEFIHIANGRAVSAEVYPGGAFASRAAGIKHPVAHVTIESQPQAATIKLRELSPLSLAGAFQPCIYSWQELLNEFQLIESGKSQSGWSLNSTELSSGLQFDVDTVIGTMTVVANKESGLREALSVTAHERADCHHQFEAEYSTSSDTGWLFPSRTVSKLNVDRVVVPQPPGSSSNNIYYGLQPSVVAVHHFEMTDLNTTALEVPASMHELLLEFNIAGLLRGDKGELLGPLGAPLGHPFQASMQAIKDRCGDVPMPSEVDILQGFECTYDESQFRADVVTN